jgi:hypothetical protein
MQKFIYPDAGYDANVYAGSFRERRTDTVPDGLKTPKKNTSLKKTPENLFPRR